MTRAGPFLRSYGGPVLLIGLCVGLLIFALWRLGVIERDMRIEATENMLWVISQTQMEALRLDKALSDHARGTADEDRVSLRYALLLSRLDLLLQGPQQRYLGRIESHAPIAAHDATIRDADPDEVIGDPDAFAVTTARLEEALADLHATLNRAANDTMVREWEAIAERLDAYRAAVWQVIGSVIGVLAGWLMIGWRLIGNERRLRLAEEERSRALSLEQALRREKAVSAYYRDFAAIVSHQFRTPLAIIDSAMQRLVRRGDKVTGDDVARREGPIRDAIHRLTRLVDTALLAGRLDSGQMSVKPRHCDLATIARDCCAQFGSLHPGRDIRFASATENTSAWCDRELVDHILANLIANALKYSNETAPVELRLFNAGSHVAIAVTDYGPGIARADRPHVFDRFYRGEAGGHSEGSGLGLSLARDLARLQGGELSFETWTERGSVFTLTLPRMFDPDSVTDAERQLHAQEGAGETVHAGEPQTESETRQDEKEPAR
ncbi:MAG: HAMP domain-containing histidine kinase [Salinarimonas sp.]|nr:HAMP domain-containing histidine kinase [Salinarimonas sp.]